MTAPLSDALLAEIEARWSDATPGPWQVDDEHDSFIRHPGTDGRYRQAVAQVSEAGLVARVNAGNEQGSDRLPWRENAEAIAHAPEDVARLLADLRLARYTLAGIARVIDAEADDASWDAGTARRLLARIAVAAHAGLGDLQTWLHEEDAP